VVSPVRLRLAIAAVCLALLGAPARAECTNALLADPGSSLDALLQAGCQLSPEQISRAMDNPVGEMVSVPISYERKTVIEPFFGTEQVIETLKVIPTFPVRLNDRWSLVNRVVLSFPTLPIDADALAEVSFGAEGMTLGFSGAAPAPADFAGTTRGFSDLTYVGLFTPNDTAPLGEGKLIWALGPTVILPTAAEDILGQGKVQFGLAAALAYLGENWTLGLFPQHWWSVGGDPDRADVNRTNIQYFVYRKLPRQWSIGAAPTVSIDWIAPDGPSVDFPVGFGLNKTFFVGRIPVRAGLEYQTYIATSGGIEARDLIRFSLSPAVPAAFLRNRRQP